MNPQVLLPGLCFFHEKSDEVFYIAHVNVDTAQLKRKVEVNGKIMHDSHHTMYANLIPVPLRTDFMLYEMGFYEYHDGYIATNIYPSIVKTDSEGIEFMVKESTRLVIDSRNGNNRFTTFLSREESKIYLQEFSFVHEIQHLIYALTGKLPLYELTQTK